MKKIKIDGKSLTLEEIKQVARDNHKICLTEEAKNNIVHCRKYVDKIIDDKETVYGINTGFGALKNKKISRDKLRELQRNLIISHSAGVGDLLSVEVVRAIMLLRINSLARGYSGIRLKTLETLIEMLNKKVHPAVPEQGSVGASGDLAPLSHIMLVLSRDQKGDEEKQSGLVISEEKNEQNNKTVITTSGYSAMKKAGIERVVLEAKEGLALNNGTNVMTAITALAVYDANILIENSTHIFTASLEALLGVSDAFYDKIHHLRQIKDQSEIAKTIRSDYAGSKLIDSYKESVQNSYSLRCFPQVAAPIKATLDWATEIVKGEINSVTDNPLIFSDADSKTKAYSGGNFHGESIALISDYLKISLSELGNISERRTYKLTSQYHNNGLPSMLSNEPGLHSGMMLMQYTAASLVSENKVLAHPASVDSIPTSENIEDHVSMGTIASRQLREILDNVKKIIAIEYIASCQALDLRLNKLNKDNSVHPEDIMGKKTFQIYRKLRDAGVDFWHKDRVAYLDIEKTISLLNEKI